MFRTHLALAILKKIEVEKFPVIKYLLSTKCFLTAIQRTLNYLCRRISTTLLYSMHSLYPASRHRLL